MRDSNGVEHFYTHDDEVVCIRCLLRGVQDALADVLAVVSDCGRRRRPTAIALALPALTTKDGVPVNYQLPNDEVATITIVTQDAEGVTVPAPAGDVFTASCSNPASLQAVIGTDAKGNAALVLTPLVQQSPGLTVTVTDSAGLQSDVQQVDIVADLAPKAIGLDVVDATTVPQAVPTNPGP